MSHILDLLFEEARRRFHLTGGQPYEQLRTQNFRNAVELLQRQSRGQPRRDRSPAPVVHGVESFRRYRAFARQADPSARIDVSLSLAIAVRESSPALVFSSRGRPILTCGRDVHVQGRAGMDFLGRLRRRIPVPEDVRRRIQPVHWTHLPVQGRRPAAERRQVFPAFVPQRDLLIVFIGRIRYAETVFEAKVGQVFGAAAGRLLAALSRDARRAWIQISFGTPGGARVALRILQAEASGSADLNDVLSSQAIVGTETVGRFVSGRGSASADDVARTVVASVKRGRVTAAEAWIYDQLRHPRNPLSGLFLGF